jgi:hypothetical protein
VEAATRGDYLARPGRVRTTCPLKQNCKRPHLSLSKFRFPPKVSSRARNIVSRPFVVFVSPPSHFCIFFVLLCRGDAVATVNDNIYALFWHDVEIFPPKMTKKGPRPRVCQSAPGGVKTVIGTCDGVRWPPNPGWCRNIGAIRSLLLYRAT